MTGIRATVSVGLHRKLTAPNLTSYDRTMNIMKGTAFIKVYNGNNSKSVCFVGNYVNLRNPFALGFQITLVVINYHKSVLK